jgi:transcriptional regulator with PAS, ATPase and Fis domain
MPPLRERREDIPALARYILLKLRRDIKRVVDGISPEAEALLQRYSWPGNVRQLQNVIERAIVMGSGTMIGPDDLPEEFFQSAPAEPGLRGAVTAFKRDMVVKALAQTGGNARRAAEILVISRPYLYQLAGELKIEIGKE